ncbi:MAG TPA: acyl-CoA desaturase, partial [Pseudonocardiaceae bacterium]|nr:acyl-CoA desaturase [Pseudonocardiaceae bacterium]
MTLTADHPPPRTQPEPILSGKRTLGPHLLVYIFVLAPMVALMVAVPVAWGWGLGWVDVVLFVATYFISLLGVTVGYHRHFTHGSFKAKRWLRVGLAVLGSTAVQGPLLHWVADHRRHHAYSDKEG